MMARPDPRLRTAHAQARLEAARSKFRRDTAPLRAAVARHRAAWLVAGGFAGGMALGLLPRRVWSGIGALLGSVASVVARSMFAPIVAGAVVARNRDKVTDQPAEP
jgi:hypothetical protein